MDLSAELRDVDILRASISMTKLSPKAFYLIILTFIFPLSVAMLPHSLFIHPLLSHHDWTLLLLFQFCYLISLFAFSLLSTAAVVFTVASLYTSMPVSFSSTLSAIPKVFRRLFVTFLGVSLLMLVCYGVFSVFFLSLIVAMHTQNWSLVFLYMVVISPVFFLVAGYITALWHLASVVSVLEPVYGFAAIRKSYELLKGKTGGLAGALVYAYLMICGAINTFFGSVVVHGGEGYAVLVRIMVGGFLIGVLVIVNLVGLLVQSVFYYVCKSYHHEGIDKSALHDHLGGYLGGYVPLKSSTEMENLEIRVGVENQREL